MPIGSFQEIVVDCANPEALARFWQALIGGEVEVESPDWVGLDGDDEGFYLSHQVRNNKKTAILAVQVSLDDISTGGGKKKKDRMFLVYRPNTGQQVKREPLSELKKKYKKVTKDEAEPHWNQQFESSAKKCSHAYWCVVWFPILEFYFYF